MSLFDINIIENYSGSDSGLLSKILLSFGGVILGFGLSQFASVIKKQRDIKKIGKSFDHELQSLKPALKNQIEKNAKYIQELSKHNFIQPTFHIYKNLDYIKTLDRLSVAEFFEKTKKLTYTNNIRTIYNCVNVIDIEIFRFEKFLNEFNEKLSPLYKSYMECATEFTRAVNEYGMQNKGEVDDFFKQVHELIDKVLIKEDGIDEIVPFEKSVHKKLLELEYNNFNNPFAPIVKKFNRDGIDIIKHIKIETESYIHKVTTVTESFKSMYKSIYNEEIN